MEVVYLQNKMQKDFVKDTPFMLPFLCVIFSDFIGYWIGTLHPHHAVGKASCPEKTTS